MTNPQHPYEQSPQQPPQGAPQGQPPAYPSQPQPGYGSQPPGVHNPYAGQSPNKPGVGLAITSLVLGILAFLNGWIPVLGMLLGLGAIIVGFIALKKQQNKIMSIIGLVAGAIGFLASTFWLIMLIAGGGSYEWSI